MQVKKSRSRKTTTKWNLFFSYFGVIYAVVSGILLVPMYLKHIPVELYGAWLASGNILVWLSMVDVGLTTVLVQRIGSNYGKGKLNEVGAYISAGIFLSIMQAVIFLTLGTVIAGQISSLLGLSESFKYMDLQGAFFLASLGTSIAFIGYTLNAVNQSLQGSFGIGLIEAISQVLSLITILVFIHMDFGLYSICFGIILRGVISLVGNLGYFLSRKMSEQIFFVFSKKHIKDLVQTLGFTSLMRLAQSLVDHTDAFLITRFLGPDITPVLVLSRKGPDVMKIILSRPGNAIIPAVAHLTGEEQWDKARNILLRFLQYIIWGCGLAMCGFLAMNEAFVKLWVGESMYAGFVVNIVIVLMLLIGIPLRNMASLCVAMGDIKGVSIVSLLAAATTVIYMVLGILYFGLLGAATAPLLSMITIFGYYIPRSFARLLHLENKDIKLVLKEFILILIIGSLIGFSFPLNPPNAWSDFVGNSAILVLFYIVLLGSLSTSFRSEFSSIILKILRKL